jgi:hypothetical protein
MAAPGSERATRRWLVETRGLGELLDVDFEAMNPMRFYRASDALLCHRATLEQTLFARVSEFFGLDWTVTLYDLTNSFTHPGVYCRRTNELTWDSEQLWRTDVMLTDLEAAFRALKSELGLRSLHHRTAERAEGTSSPS